MKIMRKNINKNILALSIAMAMASMITSCGSTTGDDIPVAETTGIETSAANETTTVETIESTTEENVTTQNTASVKEASISNTGITLYVPSEFDDIKGIVSIDGNELIQSSGLYNTSILYLGVPKSKYDEIAAKSQVTEEDINYLRSNMKSVVDIFSIDKNRDESDIVRITKDYGLNYTKDMFKLIKKVDDYSFYEFTADDGVTLEGEYADEYDMLSSLKAEMLKSAKYEKPATPYDGIIGTKLSFVTKDVDGNTITSDEIFGQHELTMINIWATWCKYCIIELPDLQALNEKISSKDCAVVGLVGDGDMELDLARSQLQDNGCSYLNILPWDGWNTALPMSGWPTSFFVNRDGVIVAEPITGAATTIYGSRIDEILSDGTTMDDEDEEALFTEEDSTLADQETGYAESAENGEEMYRIYVLDQNDDPVEGAMVEFCTDSTCLVDRTDKDGMVSFTETPGVYDIHILYVPSGYEEDTKLYKSIDAYSDMRIHINKK